MSKIKHSNKEERKPKRYKGTDGIIRYLLDGKLHNWDGPAVIYPDDKEEYYVYGIKKTKDEFNKLFEEGLPYFKQIGNNERF